MPLLNYTVVLLLGLLCTNAGSIRVSSICAQSMAQSPIRITKKDVLLRKTSNLVKMRSIVHAEDTKFHFTITDDHIIGMPKYPLYVEGDPMHSSYDLYSLHVYPAGLHVFEGIDRRAEMEVHLTFFGEMSHNDYYESKAFNSSLVIAAARRNSLLTVVYQFTRFFPGEPHDNGEFFDQFVACMSHLKDDQNVTCEVSRRLMRQDLIGYYFYKGSIMFPSCEETCKYIITNYTTKVSVKHIGMMRQLTPMFQAREPQPLHNRWVTFYSSRTESVVRAGQHLLVAFQVAVCMLL